MPTRILLCLLLLCGATVAADDTLREPLPLPKFERIVIDDDFPGGYQVEVVDIDGDERPDIVALGGGTLAWYENPTWRKRIITGPDQTPGIISAAARDLDGDGRAEVAIAFDFAMREPAKGRLGLASPVDSFDEPWTFREVAEVPSIHRVRWGDPNGDGSPDLIIAPIFGRDATAPLFQEDPAQLVVSSSLAETSHRLTFEPVFRAPVMHAIAVVRLPGDDRDAILSADNLGVTLHRRDDKVDNDSPPYRSIPLVPGSRGEPPERGASEVHLGRFGSGRALLATIEPWHGSVVAAYSVDLAETDQLPDAIGPRMVLDETLDQGHALWLADVNGDGIDEVFAGHRGDDHRVSVYHYDGTAWHRTVLDRAISAQDLRGGDLTGDGFPDVVAIGGSSSNVIWYRPLPDEAPDPASPD